MRGQHRSGIARCRKLRERVTRIREIEVIVNVTADAGVVHPTAVGVTNIIEDRVREAELGLGERLRIRCAKIRYRIIRRVQAIVAGSGEMLDRVFGASGAGALLDPERREAAVAIKYFDRLAILAAA